MHFGWFLDVIPAERPQGGDYPLPPGSPLLNGRGRFLCLWVGREEGGLPSPESDALFCRNWSCPARLGGRQGSDTQPHQHMEDAVPHGQPRMWLCGAGAGPVKPRQGRSLLRATPHSPEEAEGVCFHQPFQSLLRHVPSVLLVRRPGLPSVFAASLCEYERAPIFLVGPALG